MYCVFSLFLYCSRVFQLVYMNTFIEYPYRGQGVLKPYQLLLQIGENLRPLQLAPIPQIKKRINALIIRKYILSSPSTNPAHFQGKGLNGALFHFSDIFSGVPWFDRAERRFCLVADYPHISVSEHSSSYPYKSLTWISSISMTKSTILAIILLLKLQS